MSDTQRVYQRTRGSSRRGTGAGWLAGRAVLALVLLAVVWFFWTTRDSHPMHRLIPAAQQYRVLVTDFLAKRQRLAQSRLWQLAPAESAAVELQARVAGDTGLPDWVLNNLVYGTVQFSGNDLERPADGLFVTRMSRVGNLLARAYPWSGDVVRDHAGGLALRHIPEVGLWYAVRGRVLVVSMRRDTVVQALTLREEDALPRDLFEQAVAAAREEDLYARVRPPAQHPAAPYIDAVRLALRASEQEVRFTLRARLTDAYAEQAAPLLRALQPADLPAPLPGLAGLSLDLGQDLRDVWYAADAAAGADGAWRALWEQWTSAPRPGQDNTLQAPLLLLGELGPEIRLAWRGFALDAMLPWPQLVGLLEADPAFVNDIFVTLPTVADPDDAEAMTPRYDAQSGRMTWPLIGGPDLEPTAALQGNSLLLTSSRRVADELLSSVPPTAALGLQGNAYLVLQPGPAAEAVAEVGRLLADNAFLYGFEDATAFDAAAAPYLTLAQSLTEASCLLAYAEQEVRATLNVSLAPPPTN